MPDAQYDFSGIPKAPPPDASTYNFSGIAKAPDFTAHAEIPTAADLAKANTPEARVAILQQTPVGQDLEKVKDLYRLWYRKGPQAVVDGIHDLVKGDYAKGASGILEGAGVTAAPMVAPQLIGSAIAAPVATAALTAGTVAGGYVGQQALSRGARALGATEDQSRLAGDVGAMAGGYAASALAPKVAAALPKPTPKTVAPELTFAEQRNIPLDAATASDNWAVKGVQQLADRTLAGSLIATPAKAEQAAAMQRVGGELADAASPNPFTPEEAGTSLRTALTRKVAGHVQEANAAYEQLRTIEADPGMKMQVPTVPAPVDDLAEPIKGQLRRIVHEMDAAPFTPRLLRPAKFGGGLEPVEGTGGAGASVYDDITSRLPGTSNPPRGAVQQQLERYLAGGKETPVVKAALEVSTERAAGRGAQTVSKPELPPSAMDVLTQSEQTRAPSGEEIGLPVNVTVAKKALQPLYDQMMRQLPITQQQANPGLKAIQNILEGPDYAPLSQVDRDLSTVKALAREQGGLAKAAVTHLESAVQQAAQYGGPDVVAALQQGRAATVSKYATQDVLDTLHAEPVRTMQRLTAPKDVGIEQLRSVVSQVPDQAPVLARAYLEDLLDRPQRVADWRKLGDETKAILFPEKGQVEALDHFFSLADRMSKTNVNPSGSGYVAGLGAQGAMLWYDPIHGGMIQASGATLAKLLRVPSVVNVLMRGMTMPVAAPISARVALTTALVDRASKAGLSLVPKAADSENPR